MSLHLFYMEIEMSLISINQFQYLILNPLTLKRDGKKKFFKHENLSELILKQKVLSSCNAICGDFR